MARNARVTAHHSEQGNVLSNGYEEPDVTIEVSFDNGHKADALVRLQVAYEEVVRQIEDTKDRREQ